MYADAATTGSIEAIRITMTPTLTVGPEIGVVTAVGDVRFCAGAVVWAGSGLGADDAVGVAVDVVMGVVVGVGEGIDVFVCTSKPTSSRMVRHS